MSQVIIAGDTSGTITLQAPAVSGSSVLTLPATTATLATLTTPSFASTIGVGGATASASGAGVSFPATQSASSDANTLDDYEEGTWTPTATSQGGSITSYTSSGAYTKIGRIVCLQATITLTNVGTATGQLSLTNAPFSATTTYSYNNLAQEAALTGLFYAIYLAPSSTVLATSNLTNGGITWTNSSIYRYSLTYMTT
jgi:hypothetical protein